MASYFPDDREERDGIYFPFDEDERKELFTEAVYKNFKLKGHTAMPRVTRSAKKSSTGRTRRTRKPKKRSVEVELPLKPTPAGGSLSDFSILIHGVKKCGKTTLGIQGGKVLILQFDPPQTSVDRYEIVCTNWKTFEAALKKLEEMAASGDFLYDRILVDRVDLWYDAAMAEACSKLAIEHPSDEASWGKGWKAVENLFADGVKRVLALPCGAWFTTHSTIEEQENRHGASISVLSPTLSKQADKQLNGRVDGWFAYVYEEDERYLVIQGDERTGAGHRIDGQFLTPEGERIRTIPMGDSPQEAWDNFEAAYNNEQEDPNPTTYDEEAGEAKPQKRTRSKKKTSKKKKRSTRRS